ncbi:MAG: Mu-like prophage major head subunit gpT family protein [Spirochaetaceae bacterium]|jgi:phage major head subunit gpT-like protein|nr:Mu-like prophage major head subunit gpT family protein [Spirochaetaceae bacterium]
MIITNAVLQNLRTLVRAEFKNRMAELGAEPVYKLLCTIITSDTRSNTYAWLGQFPQMREWIGDRVIKDMAEFSYQIVNKKYESTFGVDRADIEDDILGQYSVIAREMADEVVRFFNRNIAALLTGGLTNLCYDGQPFFDTEHPVYQKADGTGDVTEVSNILGSGSAAGWYLLSLKGSLKPFILQQRSAPEMDEITDTRNDSVFMKDQYLYGIRYRGNFGYGLWQQAIASDMALTAANYEAARLAMRTIKRDGGDPMGIVPTHLVVDPTNEAAARALLEKQFIDGGDSNPNYHTAELLVIDYLPPAPEPYTPDEDE